MPRKNLIRSKVHPYHITARVNNREEFACGKDVAWIVLCNELNDICSHFNVKIHAFVMMPNHFHLLLTTPNYDLGKVMHRLMWFVTKSMNTKSGRTGRVFSGRYHWSLIDSLNYFDIAQKYIYRNPVKAKIEINVENYNFSTLYYLVRGIKNPIELAPAFGNDSLVPISDQNEFLKWLNQPFRSEEYISIRKGFRKTTFSPVSVGV